jgi:non-canonical purine NTP pyrophosphatase, rdgB/HAM1 family
MKDDKFSKLVFATSNEGKMREIREILSDIGVEVLSLKDLNIDMNVEENGSTFEENAYIKANEASKLTGLPALADDSGLEVDYINKEPGIYSARYMGEDTSYDVKNKNIIERLSKAVGDERSARFVCVISAVFPSGKILTSKGIIEGIIAKVPSGNEGFGYDPIFYIPKLAKTTAELSLEEKNRISHRGKALNEMKENIVNYMGCAVNNEENINRK